MKANQITHVFVYGTLLWKEPNHRLLASSRLVRQAKTTPEFELLDLGSFPGMVSGGSTSVEGEVYEVDQETLRKLDRLEGHPRFYKRQKIRLDDGKVVEAYLLSGEQAGNRHRIPSGAWRIRQKEKTPCA